MKIDKSVVKKLFKTSKKARIWALCVAGLFIVVLVSLFYKGTTSQDIPSFNAIPIVQNIGLGQIMQQTVDTELRISGTIEPASNVTILAPFDGVISSTSVKVGDMVKKGQEVAVLDTSIIDETLRQAESALIKAKIEVDKIKSWDNSADMQRARRTFEEAKVAANKAEKNLAESKLLFEKGIISRNEYDASVQDQLTRKNAVAAASDDLESTRKRGDSEQLQMAELDYTNAKSRFDSQTKDRANFKLYAPIDGIVTNPPSGSSSGEASKTIETGTKVQKGTTIFNLADVTSFVVAGNVDEIDINNIKNGQAVTIQSEALPGLILNGTISRVSAEAVQENSYGQAPKFKVRAEFTVADKEDRSRIRLGMSANMRIELQPPHNAIIAPIDKIIDAETRPKLRIKRDGQILIVDVVLGNTTRQGVEILDGIQEGDEIQSDMP